jgi:hypothetical protein
MKQAHVPFVIGHWLFAVIAVTCYNPIAKGMTGFDGEGWSRMASRGALASLTTEHTLQSANNTWMPVPQTAITAAPLAA